MQIDSLPEPIDQLERRLTSLAIEKSALQQGERPRLRASGWPRCDAEIAELRERADQMKSVWQKERQIIAEIRKLKEEIDAAKTEAELAQRKGDFNRAAELRFGRLPELEKRLAAKDAELKAAQKGGSFLREEVTEEDIAAVVSKWTGIPVEKMLEGEQSRLTQMEERLHQRVVGQDEAVGGRGQRRPPGAGRAAGPQPAHRVVHLPGPDRRGQDRAGPGAGRRSCSTTRPTWCASTCPNTWRNTRSRA